MSRAFFLRNFFAGSWWRRVVARTQTVIEAKAPLGYEDETGFHVVNEKSPALSDAAMQFMPGRAS